MANTQINTSSVSALFDSVMVNSFGFVPNFDNDGTRCRKVECYLNDAQAKAVDALASHSHDGQTSVKLSFNMGDGYKDLVATRGVYKSTRFYYKFQAVEYRKDS